MSILIKGMEMPRKCIRCPFVGAGYCTINDKYIYHTIANGEKDVDCLLIELPPHGDLIDRIKLLHGSEDGEVNIDMYVMDNGLPKDYRNGLIAARRVICLAPTVIEAEGS